ncbi:two-component regulator propeller domain-containing protein [Chitinispirillales bacterium ANBcel5]|uniref:two-component regulator propeller domain-containing protein n=1 Tax=Cellulosispirillum alkaliphilum TaxID=3039283 RepID=UPI002A56E35C|nr:two-component regulator propeller domain-containing protein [Chitinispirillales bacterium ANBcel5]
MIKIIIVFILAAVTIAHSLERFTNYGATTAANGFLKNNDSLLVASSGGLFIYNTATGDGELIDDSHRFPDPDLTAITQDEDGTIWIGSRNGYLYRRSRNGTHTVFSNYHLAEWGINDIYPYRDYLLIASDRGCSVFDPKREAAIKNASRIGDFFSSRVNTIRSYNDTIYLGCEEGIATLSTDLSRANFYDRTIWETDSSHRVMDFTITDTGVIGYSSPQVTFKGKPYSAQRGNLVIDSEVIGITPHSNIVSFYNDNDNWLWIGTGGSYFYLWDGVSQAKQITIPGMPLKDISRVYTAKSGDVWLLPVPENQPRRNTGITRFDGTNWQIYNNFTHGGDFGYIGEGHPMNGITEDRNGDMWVGTYGGHIKHISPAQNSVSQLYIGRNDDTRFEYISDGGELPWGKTPALALDSNGYIWFSVYRHHLGGLICFNPNTIPDDNQSDPVRAGFRRFFPETSPHWSERIRHISIDKNNRIFTADLSGRLMIHSYQGNNPLSAELRVLNSSSSLGTISRIEAAPDGTTLIISSRGLFAVHPNSTTPEALNSNISATSLAVQNEETLWLGTNENGIIRYDLFTEEETRFTVEQGLISNNVVDINYDKDNGFLWIATNQGLSVLDLGSTEPISSEEKIVAYPNPFSISNRNQGASRITFSKLDPNSNVAIYAMDGTLAKQIASEPVSRFEWRAQWRPASNLSPGVYFAIISPTDKRHRILLIP